MKIGIAQINTTVGDLQGNRETIIAAYQELCRGGTQLIICPELAVTGYPPRDLIFKSQFVTDNEDSLRAIARCVGETPLITGFIAPNPSEKGRRYQNSAAWCQGGKVAKVFHKCLLPTYDVFDEDRYFQGAERPGVMKFRDLRVGVTICEDIWTAPFVETRHRYSIDPIDCLIEEGIDLLVNLSASPWHCGKGSLREKLVIDAASRCRCPAVCCNAIGGNDELIFDGHSMLANAAGTIVSGLRGFAEDLQVVDTEDPTPQLSPSFRQSEIADIHDALVLGLRDYAHKCGFERALVGLSGGIDSSVTAALATDALGSENVIGISLPSKISSQHSRDDASTLARNLGIQFHTLPIADIVASAEATLQPLFQGLPADVTEENLQARSRGLLLMAVSNKLGALLLTTGNKSELAVGYCTLYGDMCGGLAVISDLPKIKTYELARWINRERENIPVSSIEKTPSAELRPDQKDEDSLPPYPVLDEILQLYIEEGKSASEIADAGFEPDVVREMIRKVDLNEIKRTQAAPGLKITPLAFGVGRRIPIVQRYVS